MSWSIYFIAFLTIFVPQWEAIFYIFLFFSLLFVLNHLQIEFFLCEER